MEWLYLCVLAFHYWNVNDLNHRGKSLEQCAGVWGMVSWPAPLSMFILTFIFPVTVLFMSCNMWSLERRQNEFHFYILVKTIEAKKCKVNVSSLPWAGHESTSLLPGPSCMTVLQIVSVLMLPGRQCHLYNFISSCPFRRGELYKYIPICWCFRWADIWNLYTHKACGWIWLAYSNSARAEHPHCRGAKVH